AARHRDGVLRVTGTGDEAARAVASWYRRAARERIEVAVEREAARLDLSPTRISIRDQRTRWGSCSRSGALSFSWRLILAPLPVLEYVVVHELCHLRRHDHSPAFWALVEHALPGWRAHAQWLADHGAALHGYRPELVLAGTR
ncbi:MAG: M48 family metallopeptidase, partial [Actinobacteria bacterium]|nr:M48 family metallopeptidase [Actinomycetota bacterium]